jgi:hypothetical protein
VDFQIQLYIAHRFLHFVLELCRCIYSGTRKIVQITERKEENIYMRGYNGDISNEVMMSFFPFKEFRVFHP